MKLVARFQDEWACGLGLARQVVVAEFLATGNLNMINE